MKFVLRWMLILRQNMVRTRRLQNSRVEDSGLFGPLFFCYFFDIKTLNSVIIYDNIIDVLRMLQFVSTRHENLLNSGDLDEEVT